MTMSDLNILFRQRIGFPLDKQLTFEHLPEVLTRAAQCIPFENLRIISRTTTEISRDSLIEKILQKQEGGLCYELNTMLYLFLTENGFRAQIVRGIVFNHDNGEYQATGRTHITVLLEHEGQQYLADTGFGGNLPLRPVPLTGDIVSSENGDFRVSIAESVHGNYIFEMKLKHKDTDWRIGYAFHSSKPVTDYAEVNEIQHIITTHPLSGFNKHPLITRLTNSGSVTLTSSSLTQWENGQVTKEQVDSADYPQLLTKHFGR